MAPKKKGNNYIIDEENNIAKIELNRTKGENFWVTIDLEDLERVLSFPYTWYAKYSATIGKYYAATSEYRPEIQKARTVLLHQFIMGVEDSTREVNVDHKNHDTLDDRKENLRVTNVTENCMNRKLSKANKSGYRNVSWSKNENAWIVQLQVDGKNTVLGTFSKDQLEEAGKFAKKMREKYYGEFAGIG